PIGYGTLVGVYVAVGCGVVWILRRLARTPLGGGPSDSSPPLDSSRPSAPPGPPEQPGGALPHGAGR
ncbi:MAG TPA: hypothetical protein VLJ42_12595, partial [Solirubrobacteraceae bacterium]|nr:hypothetical protein [Solirubrobacteraceae bacterium]